MKQILTFFILITLSLAAHPQYYTVPDWFAKIPASNDTCIYAIGISEPRMDDTAFALKVATYRALGIASMLQKSQVSYASDYFETTSEEHRTLIMKETVQELAKIESFITISNDNYEIVEQEMNDNGEMIVLVKYFIGKLPPNTTVCSEFFRQDYEVSNTLHLEKIRSISISVEKSDSSGTTKMVFKAFNLNNSRSFEISYDSVIIVPKGYYYNFSCTACDSIDIGAFTSGTSLEKGLWNAFIESFLTAVIRKSKNYKSQFEVVDDSYYSAIDNAPDKSNGSLSRQVACNEISLHIGSIVVDKNNMLQMSLLLPEEVQKDYTVVTMQGNSARRNENGTDKCWFRRLFKKKGTD